MFRKMVLSLLPLALLAAACTGGDSLDSRIQQDASEPTAERPTAVNDGTDEGRPTQPRAAPTATPPAAIGDGDRGSPPIGPSAEPPAAISDPGDAGDGDAGEALFGALNPFDLLGGFDPAAGPEVFNQNVDPSLKAPLIVAGDLPPRYSPLGEFAFSLPTEYGPMEMAASQFQTGDPSGMEMGSMVMSAVMSLPPEAMEELGDLSELEELTEADLAELQDLEGLGMGFENVHILDTSGLGDGGAGFHMEINFGDLFESLSFDLGDDLGEFDAEFSQEEIPMPDGIGMDVYMFVRGERMLMLVVMWPLGENPGVNARELADTMNTRAAAAF